MFNYEKWIEERNNAAYSFNVETFKKFYNKYYNEGVYKVALPSDEIIEIAMRQMVCGIQNPDKTKLKEAKKWLKERGYKTRW